jgi:hypothetical protein
VPNSNEDLVPFIAEWEPDRWVFRGGLGRADCRRESRRINCSDRFNRIEILIDFLLPMPHVGVDVEMEAVRAVPRALAWADMCCPFGARNSHQGGAARAGFSVRFEPWSG